MKRIISTLGLMTVLAVGCASSPTVPPARVASTEAALQSAREAGADRDPEASTQLAKAEDKLGQAKALISKKSSTEQAEDLLTRAKSDAALAAALATEAEQEAKTRAEPQRVRAKQPPRPDR